MSTAITKAERHRPPLERRYAALLRFYPIEFRARHGSDMLGTLMETSREGQRMPSFREGLALVREGLRLRAQKAAGGPVPWWADGLHLGVTILAAVHLMHVFHDIVLQGRDSWVWVALSVALLLALLRGWVWAALPLGLFTAFVVARAMLFGYPATADWPMLANATVYLNWVSLTPYLLTAAGVVALATRRPRELRPRSWWWAAIPAGMAGADVLLGVELYSRLGEAGRVALEGGLLLAALWLTATTRSPRWSVAAAIYVVPGEISTILTLRDAMRSTAVLAYWIVLGLLLLAVIAAALQDRPRPQGEG